MPEATVYMIFCGLTPLCGPVMTPLRALPAPFAGRSSRVEWRAPD